MMSQRCSGCDEPQFMCECNKHHKNYKGEVVRAIYHRGVFIGEKELRRQMFFLACRPTIIIGRVAFLLVSPDRHFGNRIFEGVR